MSFEVGRKFWIAATAVIVVVTLFVVGRNSLHAVKIKRQINAMTREKEYYRTKIEQDSTLLERLQYDDYLESTPAKITTCSGGANTSILSRNKSYAGRRLPGVSEMRRPSGRCFLLWLPRGDMAAEGRYACREVICRAVRWGGVCSGAVFFVAAC